MHLQGRTPNSKSSMLQYLEMHFSVRRVGGKASGRLCAHDHRMLGCSEINAYITNNDVVPAFPTNISFTMRLYVRRLLVNCEVAGRGVKLKRVSKSKPTG
jgi:hypothetical protein